MIHHGDLFDVLPTLEADSIDACVTDPPYDLTANKRGGSGAASLNLNSPAGRSRITTGGGFMGKEWDGTGVAFNPDTWRAVYRVLKPGAHLLAFGGTRTFHRMTCAIEDAGFEIRDCLSWLYGQGFPKSMDVGKALDGTIGKQSTGFNVAGQGIGLNSRKELRSDHPSYQAYVPSTDLAKQWQGWGTALKPSWEPIILARKPLTGTVAANVAQFGTGAINIDACRLAPMAPDDPSRRGLGYGFTKEGWDRNEIYSKKTSIGYDDTRGRWPANVLLDEQSAKLLDEQTGELVSGGTPEMRYADKFQNTFGAFKGCQSEDGIGRSAGGASRFFYCAKPSREERDYGCDGLPARSGGEATDRQDGAGVNSPRAGAGRTGGSRNIHPTVKPVELMRWLVRLVVPPDGTCLDHFAGSGTTGMACRYEQRRFIGIEREAEYVAIAKRRIAAVAPLFGEASA